MREQDATQSNQGPVVSRRTLLGWAAALGGSMAFASACGSGDGGGGGGKGLTGQAAISGLQSIVTAAPFAIAAEKFYADGSVKMSNVHVSGGTDTVRSIMGKSPVGSAATVSSIIAHQAGAKNLRIIAGGFNAPSVVFVGKSGSAVTRDKELSGKKIGIAGTGTPVEFFAKLAVTKAGYTPGKEVEIVTVGDYASVWPSVKEGIVDLGALVPPQSAQATMSGEGEIVISSSDLMPKWADTSICTTADVIKDEPEALRTWLKAVDSALTMIREDLPQAGQIWGAHLDLPREVAEEALKSVPTEAWTLDLDMSFLKEPAAAAVDLGLTKKADVGDLFDGSILEGM